MTRLYFLLAIFLAAGSLHAQNPAHKGKMAIVPFHFVIDQMAGSEEVSYQVQQDAFTILSKNSGNLEIQDPETTNALLAKAGITLEGMRGFTFDEICNALGVEYVVGGTVKQTMQQVVTNSTNQNTKEVAPTYNRRGKETSAGGYQTTTTQTQAVNNNYTTNVTLSIHNDQGGSVFNQNHTSTWNGPEAYKNTINFLWKKTSFYVK